eukprot:1141067-Pelagomonas_calceolata.AAC.1
MRLAAHERGHHASKARSGGAGACTDIRKWGPALGSACEAAQELRLHCLFCTRCLLNAIGLSCAWTCCASLHNFSRS